MREYAGAGDPDRDRDSGEPGQAISAGLPKLFMGNQIPSAGREADMIRCRDCAKAYPDKVREREAYFTKPGFALNRHGECPDYVGRA